MKKGENGVLSGLERIFEPGKFEEDGYKRGYRCVAGLDEVGRGPLAGPVVAAAVVLERGVFHPEIKDSKLLSEKKREEIAAWIKENALAWSIGLAESEEIDKINILQASLLAMARALRQLRIVPDYLLIDGREPIPIDYLYFEQTQIQKPGRTVKAVPCQRPLIKGDRFCVSIAAASIVAKVARDQMMKEYDRIYPGYGFGIHKGYSSALHLKALKERGPAFIHRKSFKRVSPFYPYKDSDSSLPF